MDELITTVSSFLVDIAATILISIICLVIKELAIWIKGKIKNERCKTAVDELERTVIDGINFVEQTLVSYYKAKGTWNEEFKKFARDECLAYIERTLTEQTKQYLTEDTKTTLESLILGKIEAELGKLHSN